MLFSTVILNRNIEPGCTKSINYYGFLREPLKLDNPRMYLVDLPGIFKKLVFNTSQLDILQVMVLLKWLKQSSRSGGI